MGARIEGIGSNVLIVHGESALGGADYAIGPDYIEVGQLHRAGRVHRRRAADQGRGGRRPAHDPARLRAAGLPDRVRRRRRGRARPARRCACKDDEGDAVSKIEDGPWPAFPADLTSIALALATQAEGMVLIHEKMFENRLFFVDKLVSMGARVIVCDPHRAVVSGPSRLHAERMESPDIRAGMAMLIAALCAEGTSEIGNIRQIDRGYERIDERLRALGARIERVADRASARLAAGGTVIHPIPPGTRDVLPDEMRELRAITRRPAAALREAPATARCGRRRWSTRRCCAPATRTRRARASARSTSRATCWRCART